MAKAPVATTIEPTLTKMARARGLYAEIVRTPAPEGKTHRGIFMERAESIGLSSKAANTYFQNIKNEMEAAPAVSAVKPAAKGLKAELDALRTISTELNTRLNQLSKQVA